MLWIDEVYLSDRPDILDPQANVLRLPDENLFRYSWIDHELAVGESYTETLEIELTPSASGQYVIVRTDVSDAVDEFRIDNNELVVATDVQPVLSDLVVTDMVAEAIGHSGEMTTLRYTVTNVGDHPIWPGSRLWYDYIWISADPQWIGSASTLSLRGTYLGEVVHVHDDPIAAR